MDDAYRPEAWHDLCVMVGGAAAALTGLIFVAVSLHLREVLRDPWHRGTAGSSLLGLMSVVLIAGALLVPSQAPALLGAEIATVALTSLAVNARALVHLPSRRRARTSVELVIGLTGGLLAICAGISVVAGVGGGLRLLVPGLAIALGTSVRNAWRLMVDVATGPSSAGVEVTETEPADDLRATGLPPAGSTLDGPD